MNISEFIIIKFQQLLYKLIKSKQNSQKI